MEKSWGEGGAKGPGGDCARLPRGALRSGFSRRPLLPAPVLSGDCKSPAKDRLWNRGLGMAEGPMLSVASF